MGLDSIELLVEIEQYFGIHIPDSEAEKIYTIQNMVDSVATHLNISDNSKELRDKIFQNIKEILAKSNLTEFQFELTDFISKHLPRNNKSDWDFLEIKLGLEIPKPDVFKSDKKNFFYAIKSAINWTDNVDWDIVTLDEFITVICASNYQKLIDNKNIKSKYEIYVAVAGITVDRIGVDYFEIGPDKSFTNDLGVD